MSKASSRPSTPLLSPSDYLENKGGYCVACGVRYVPNNALERCDESSRGLSHLWAKNGHVEDWFPYKRDRRGALIRAE